MRVDAQPPPPVVVCAVAGHAGQQPQPDDRGVTKDGGRSWDWTRLTEETVEDYLRPMAAVLNDGRVVLVALHGDYPSMHAYNLRVVGCMLD